MIEPESHEKLRREIGERIRTDRALLDSLRDEIRPLRQQVRRIQPRMTTSISLVGTDGGNNSLAVGRLPLPGGLIYGTDYWRVEHCVGPLGVGTLLVKPRRHVTRVSELTGSEAAELGRLLYQAAADRARAAFAQAATRPQGPADAGP